MVSRSPPTSSLTGLGGARIPSVSIDSKAMLYALIRVPSRNSWMVPSTGSVKNSRCSEGRRPPGMPASWACSCSFSRTFSTRWSPSTLSSVRTLPLLVVTKICILYCG